MAYNKKGYRILSETLRRITAQHYEPGRQDRCLHWVWRHHIRPHYGMCYQTYLKHLKEPKGAGTPKNQIDLF